jgi:hypothetical protein
VTDTKIADEASADNRRQQIARSTAPIAGPNHFIVDWQLPIGRLECNPFRYLNPLPALVGPARGRAAGDVHS